MTCEGRAVSWNTRYRAVTNRAARTGSSPVPGLRIHRGKQLDAISTRSR